LLLVTGKGGIGKTLVAASLGQAAAALGKRTLLLEFGAVDQLAPLFGVSKIGHERQEVQPGLFCANIDPEQNFKDFIVKYLGQKKLFDRVISHRVMQSFIKTIPGLAELMMLGRLFFEGSAAPGPRFDLIIFDGPASGHFLNMMTTPDAVLRSHIAGPLRKETLRVKEFLSQPEAVGCLYVTVPEDLVISEAIDFLPQLAEKSPAPLLGVMMNRVPVQLMPHGSRAEPDSRREAATINVDQTILTNAWEAHEQRAAKALGEFAEASIKLKKDDHMMSWYLPDLIAVDEPLPADFWRTLLGGVDGPLAELSVS
jgi:anion-transporting  ArsA/GET3 family ATPase